MQQIGPWPRFRNIYYIVWMHAARLHVIKIKAKTKRATTKPKTFLIFAYSHYLWGECWWRFMANAANRGITHVSNPPINPLLSMGASQWLHCWLAISIVYCIYSRFFPATLNPSQLATFLGFTLSASVDLCENVNSPETKKTCHLFLY